MKKVTVALILFFCLNSFAEISLGLNLRTRFNNTHIDEDTESTTRTFSFSLVPSVIITPTDRVEVVPFGGFSTFNTWVYNEEGDEVGEGSSWGLTLGTGLFFRLFETDPIRFSFGPEFSISPSWSDADIGTYNFSISAPVNIDFLFSDAFFVRMSASIAGIGLTLVDYEDSNNGRTIFDTEISTVVGPSLGFFFTF